MDTDRHTSGNPPRTPPPTDTEDRNGTVSATGPVTVTAPGPMPALPHGVVRTARPPVSVHHQLVTVLTLIVTAWLAVSPMVLPYPLTTVGRSALGWTGLPGVVLAVLAVARVRSPGSTRKAAVGLLVGGPVLIAAALLSGYGPATGSDVVRWNLVLVGIAVTVLSVIGLAPALVRPRRPVDVPDRTDLPA